MMSDSFKLKEFIIGMWNSSQKNKLQIHLNSSYDVYILDIRKL